MKDFFLASFPDLDKKIDWDTWFDKPGYPIVEVEFSMTLANAAINLAKKYVKRQRQRKRKRKNS